MRQRKMSWRPMSFLEQKKFDDYLRKERAQSLCLKSSMYRMKYHGHNILFLKWKDSDNRIYHYEVLDHTWDRPE